MKKLFFALISFVLIFTMLTTSVCAAENTKKSRAQELADVTNTVYGTISKGESHWYSFVTDAEISYYNFTLNNESGSTNAHLIVYDVNDSELVDVGYYTGAGKSASGSAKLNPSQKYYIKIYFNDDGVGNYSFEIDKKPDPIGNRKQSSAIIGLDKTYYQSIDGAGDIDWYVISTDDKEAYYYFYLKNESGTGNAEMKIYNDRDTEILTVGYYTSAGEEAVGSVKLPVNSKCYLRLQMGNEGVGNYNMKVWRCIDEVGNEKETSKGISLNRTVESAIDGAGDVDYFALITVPTTGEYKFTLNNISGSGNATAVLYSNRDEKLLSVGNYTGAGESASDNITLQKDGVYYIKVSFGNDGTGSYSFNISQCVDGHTESDVWTTIKEPTCIAEGEQAKLCTVCGEVLDTDEIDELGHNTAEWKVVREATWISLGQKSSICTTCGEEIFAKDWSKVWILPTIVVGAILVIIGIINYIRAFLDK